LDASRDFARFFRRFFGYAARPLAEHWGGT
jgi:hypothetical protein